MLQFLPLIGLLLVAFGFQANCRPDPFVHDRWPPWRHLEDPWKYDPARDKVIPGESTERHVMNLHPGGPNAIKTFPCPIQIQLDGGQVRIDKVVQFSDLNISDTSGQGKIGYYGTDYLTFTIFLYDGIVRHYDVYHTVRSSPDADWSAGEYSSTGYPADQKFWQRIRAISNGYLEQRRDLGQACDWSWVKYWLTGSGL
ncbi:MAG TPA: hypothetical protein DEA96_02650 [Leptospiraceae bacterium]|nr:hypothetical protein [Spirochaetaceae bacterium]HBS03836.1 hypothetical protein [Leptospiraceae bacterium]